MSKTSSPSVHFSEMLLDPVHLSEFWVAVVLRETPLAMHPVWQGGALPSLWRSDR